MAAACAAGAVHDCRRRDDRADPGHGRRAAAWFHRHADAVTSAIGHTLPPAAPHRTALAIAPHDIPYDHFTAAQDRSYGSAPHLVDVLKAADGLDRYRFPLKRWWPDLAQLRLPLPAWMAPATFALVVASERAWLDGAASADALATAHQMLTRGQKEARAWAATSTPRTPTTPARWSRGRACPKGAGASGPGAGWRGAVEWRAAPGQPGRAPQISPQGSGTAAVRDECRGGVPGAGRWSVCWTTWTSSLDQACDHTGPGVVAWMRSLLGSRI
ncbi:hypothetical protein [Streptomyces sp.]|uniref:hypothetical protein n=1 Tax=Streptomyces sp. TaxID=1931 RepID=UPI002F94708D